MFIRILILMTLLFTSFVNASVSTPSSRTVNPKLEQFITHKESLIEASKLSGIPIETITAIASHETGIGLNTRNPYSSVKGVMQHTDRTWNYEVKQFHAAAGLPRNVSVHNPRASIIIGSMGMAEDKAYLEKTTRVKLQDGDIFMARFVGRYGAKAILNGNPNSPISRYVKIHPGNGNMYKVNGRIATVKEFRAKMNNIIQQEKRQYAKQIDQAKFDMFIAGLMDDKPAHLVLANL